MRWNKRNAYRTRCGASPSIHIFNLYLYLIHIIMVIIYYGFGVVVCAWSLLLHSETHFTNPPSFRLLLRLTLINRFLGWTGTNGIIRYGYISVLYIFFFEHKINYMVDRDPTLYSAFVVYSRTKQTSGKRRKRR